jgi:hypothetical protein
MSELDLPFISWFRRNPIGGLIALFLLFLVIAYWKSNLPTNPFASTAIAGTGTNATQGFGSTSWISLWGQDFNATNWFMAIAIPMMMLAVAFYAYNGEDEDSELAAPRTDFASRLRRASKLKTGREEARGAETSLAIVHMMRGKTPEVEG